MYSTRRVEGLVVHHAIQSDLTYPHTSVLDEVVDKERELEK